MTDATDAFRTMSTKHKGTHSELVACAWLLKQGYDVFRNVSPHGRIDLIAVKNNEIICIDVKTDREEDVYDYYRSKFPPAGVAYLWVSPEGDCRLTAQTFSIDDVRCTHRGMPP